MIQALALALTVAAQAAAPAGPHHEHLVNPPEVPLRARERLARPIAPPTAGPDVWVYGFLAYWTDGPDALDWDRLTHVAIFNVDLNSDGTLADEHRWHDWAPEAMALAEPYGVKVHLTLTCFSDSVMGSVISSPSTRGRTVEALGALVDEYGAHGVNIDCEGMDSYLRDDFTDFVEEVGDRVGEVTVATPAVDWNGSYDYEALAAVSDGLFIMGYGYHWSSSDPGPVAPLHGGHPWSDYSLSWSVEDYIYYGAPPEKIILGLPLYGRDWPSTSNAVPGTATGDSSSVTMSAAVDEAEIYGRSYDTVTDTPYYFPDSRSQVWYDDTDSIREKVGYAVEEGLLGVGFWALNYEGGDPDFWDMMEEETHFSTGDGGDGGDGSGGDGDGGDGGDGAGGDGGDGAGGDGGDGAGGDDTGPITDDTGDSDLVAYAGRDVLAYAGDKIFLAGGGEGAANLNYEWVQRSGAGVNLANDQTANPSFTADTVGTLTFELTVYTSPQDRSAPDSVSVVVARVDASGAFGASKGCGCASGGGGGVGGGALGLVGLIGLIGLVRRRRE